MTLAPPSRRWLIALARAALSLGLLAALWFLVDGPAVLARLAAPEPLWILAALALSLPQHLLSAARWSFTAGRLGARLGFRQAVADYYLASFLNQLLPGGVAGDLLRAWRHGRVLRADDAGGLGPALRAVILERLSGQIVLLMFAAAGLAFWPFPAAAPVEPAGLFALAAVLIAVVAAMAWLIRRAGAAGRALAGFLAEARQALVARGAAPVQLALSSLIVASYVATYACAARALGLLADPVVFLALVPLVLLAMSLPLSVAGWGLREASAAGLWAAAGLPVADGVAISLVYGLLILLASLPGALVLLGGNRTGRADRAEN